MTVIGIDGIETLSPAWFGIDDRAEYRDPARRPARIAVRRTADGRASARAAHRCPAAVRRTGPTARRPAGAPVRYRGNGVLMSQTSHRPRPITPARTAALALIAAGITIWLGLVAHLGGTVGSDAAPVPEKLGVVQVHPGESLQHLAERVAPNAPTARVADRIRQLNQLDSAMLDAGQTLIAPIG